MNIYDCRFVDNEANSVFHMKQLGNSKKEVENFWRGYLAADGSKYSFVDVKLFLKDDNTAKNSACHSMLFKVKSVWTDSEKKHSIEELCEANGYDEIIAVLREVLDVPSPDVIEDGFQKHAETLKRYGADEEFIISEWDRMEESVKMYTAALTALIGLKKDPSRYADVPYVIDIDNSTKVYINAIPK